MKALGFAIRGWPGRAARLAVDVALRVAGTIAVAVAVPFAAFAQTQIRPAYTADYVAQMLDYVARDYPLAVANGRIVNHDEYAEQLQLTRAALEVGAQVSSLAAQPAIRSGILGLLGLIEAKAASAVIRKHALQVRNDIFAAAGPASAPAAWPSLAQGGSVYAQHCAACHGIDGDGRGAGSTPRATDFRDAASLAALSPVSAFHAIRAGLQKTAMPPFPALSDDEAWAAAFYVVSLRHGTDAAAGIALDRGAADLWLKATASLPDAELMRALPGSPAERARLLAALRTHKSEPR